MFDRLAIAISAATGHPAGVVTAIVASLLGWRLLGIDTVVLLVTLVTWWQLFPMTTAAARDTREIVALLRQLAEDLPDVDDARVDERIAEEA